MKLFKGKVTEKTESEIMVQELNGKHPMSLIFESLDINICAGDIVEVVVEENDEVTISRI